MATGNAAHLTITNADGSTGNPTYDVGTDVMLKDGTNTMAASGTIDASAQTGANSFKVPVKAAATATSNGSIAYDSTNNNLHVANTNADAIVPIVSGTPTNGDGVQWSVAGGTQALADTGAAVVTPSSTTTFTNKTTTDPSNNILILNHQSSAAAVTGTSSFATLATFTIPANTIGANGCIRVTGYAQHASGTGSVNYRWQWGATTYGSANSTTTNVVYSQTLICNTGATNAQDITSASWVQTSTTMGGSSWQAGTADTTTGIAVTLQFNAANTDTVSLKTFLVEVLH